MAAISGVMTQDTAADGKAARADTAVPQVPAKRRGRPPKQQPAVAAQ